MPVEVEMAPRAGAANDSGSSATAAREGTLISPRSEAVTTTGMTYSTAIAGSSVNDSASSAEDIGPSFRYDKTLEEVRMKRTKISSKGDVARSSKESSKIGPSASPPRSPQPYTSIKIGAKESGSPRASGPIVAGVEADVDTEPDKNVVAMKMEEITGSVTIEKNKQA